MEKLNVKVSGIATKAHVSKQPSIEVIEALVDNAIRSPSGDNAQPWNFQWNGERLLVLHSESLAQHTLNRKNHASMLAFGAMLESLRLTATTHGLNIKTKLLFDQTEALSSWAEIRFSPSKAGPDPLALMIPKRSTDRRNYQGGKISAKLRSEIRAIQRDYPTCKIHIQEDQSKEFMSYFLRTEAALWKNSKIVRDLGKWLRLSKKEVNGSLDGMSWKNIGINAVEALCFRLIRKYPSLPRLLWSLGFGIKIKMQSKKAIQSSSALLCFSCQSINAENLCKVGEMAFRIWLLLNANGFGVQPLSFSSSSIGDLISGAMPANTSPEEVELFKHGKNALQRNFSMHKLDVPIWMFRTGISSDLPSDYRAPKKSAQHVMLMPKSKKVVPMPLKQARVSLQKKLYFALPKSIRFALVRNFVKVPAFCREANYTVEIANTKQDLETARRLLHDCYVAQKLMKANPSRQRSNIFSSLQDTKTIVVKHEGDIVGTLTLIRDGSLGLPSDKEFKRENDSLRIKGRNLIEVSALAVKKSYRKNGHAISLLLMKYSYRYASQELNSSLVCTVHPRAQDFYEGLCGFERQGLVIKYPFANGALAVHMNLEISRAKEALLAKKVKDLFAWIITDDSRLIYPQNFFVSRRLAISQERGRLSSGLGLWAQARLSLSK